MSTSKRIIRHYATLIHWYDGMVTAASCWKVQKATGIEWTAEERTKLHEASYLVNQAKGIVDEIFSSRIGKAVTYDIRAGSWGSR